MLLAVIVGAVLLGMRAAAFNATVSSAAFPSTQLLGPLNGSDRVNVLMVGYGGPGHDGAYLADSIQILSIDPETDTTVTIPIPRDLWIEGIAALPQNGKVNEVFAQGYINGDESLDTAGALMADVLSTVTGLEIHHWLSIDFTGFRDMVDAVGGVTIDNPVAFSYTTNEEVHLAGNWNTGHFKKGEIHLNGKRALAYSRARYTSVVSESTDFARSVRQARVLAAMRSSVGDGGLGAIAPGLGLMDAMEGRVRTDMSVIDLFLLSSHLTSDRRVELSEGPVLTATTNTDGQYILVPDGLDRAWRLRRRPAVPHRRARRGRHTPPFDRCAVGGASASPTSRASSSAAWSAWPASSRADTVASRARTSTRPMPMAGSSSCARPTRASGCSRAGAWSAARRRTRPRSARCGRRPGSTSSSIGLVLVDARRARDTSFIFAGHVTGGAARAAAR